jgi:hypothetical protein
VKGKEEFLGGKTMSRTVVFFVVASFLATRPLQLSAQGILLGAIADLTGKDLIGRAKSAAEEVLADFDNKANFLSARISDQLTVAAESAELLAGGELDRQVKNMSQPLQQVMVNLQQLVDGVNGLKSDAYNLKDALVVDIRALTENVPLVGEKFYIQSIDGVLQLQKDSPYEITVLGVGLGPASEKHSSSVGLKIGTNPQPVTDITVDQIHAGTAVISIPQSDLNPLFKPTPIRVPASLEFDMTDKDLLGPRKTRHYSIPFGLTLIPTNAGTISVAVRVHTYGWTDTGVRDKKLQPTPDLNGAGRYEYYTLDLKVATSGRTPPTPGDQKYRTSDIKFDCIYGGLACGFKDVFYIQPMNHDSQIQAYWRTNSNPTVWQLSAEIMQWSQTGDQDQPPSTKPIRFGENVLIQVPDDWELVHITGKTVTGEAIDLIYPSGSDLLRALPVQPGSNTIIYFVNRPDGT